jgi:hypothetical protein
LVRSDMSSSKVEISSNNAKKLLAIPFDFSKLKSELCSSYSIYPPDGVLHYCTIRASLMHKCKYKKF